MELLREFSVTDKELIASARQLLNKFYASNISLNICTVFKAKEMQSCLDGIADVNKKILDCTDVQKLYIFQQSKILKLNRLSALMATVSEPDSELFANHEPVRLIQAELATQKIFAS